MLLIVDAGSTKTTWCLVSQADGTVLRSFRSAGINASTMSPDVICETVHNEVISLLEGLEIKCIHFYGAGVMTDQNRTVIKESLAPIGAGSVTVESDMLGAARAVLGHDAGLTCILGTGSNTCLYDGAQIIDNVPSLGYILGDEGSGASLGRRFVSDLFKRMLPDVVMEKWRERVGLDMAGVIERVYRQPGGNTFLGSMVPLVKEMIDVEEVAAMVEDEFDRFFDRNVERYNSGVRRLGFVGSVAVHFKDILERVGERRGYDIGPIAGDPMEGIVGFHLSSYRL